MGIFHDQVSEDFWRACEALWNARTTQHGNPFIGACGFVSIREVRTEFNHDSNVRYYQMEFIRSVEPLGRRPGYDFDSTAEEVKEPEHIGARRRAIERGNRG